MKKNKFVLVIVIFLGIILVQPKVFNKVVTTFTSQNFASQFGIETENDVNIKNSDNEILESLKKLEFDGINQVIELNENTPTFTNEELDLSKSSWEDFSSLDLLNRVGQANAMLNKEMMPTEKRESIADVKPTGWHNKKIEFNGKQDYLYNRCHLIGFQLSGQNANIKNLFTGTRSLNANFQNEKNSMVYYENLVAEYLRQTNDHVRYQVTPIFNGVELVARGVRIQAKSIESDQISFNIYIFNIQEGYQIDYLTGYSKKIE